MSINGLQNTNLIINTIDGLTNIWATDIYENGQKLSVAGLVPYTGANQMVDLNNQTIRTTHTPSNNADLINLETLTNAVTFVDNSVSLTYLNKITTTPQTVDGKVTFNKELAVINNKKTNLSSKLVVDSNYKSNLTSGSITATQGLGTITNVGIVYEVSTTSTNPGILNLFPITAGTRYRFSIELLGGFGSTTTYLQTSQSEDGINPYTSGIIDVRIFPNGSTDYETLDYTFEALTNGYVIIEISTDDPSGITGLKWKNFTTYNMGVYLDNITTTITASKVPIINDKQQLVSSGVDSIKITYLDNVSSDIQTQLNNKVDISTLSDYALLAGNNTFTGNNQFQNGNTTTTGITSFKNNSACDIDKGYELNAAFQTSTFTRRLGRISFLRNAGGTDYSGYMGLDVSTDGALYKRMLTLHKDNGVSAGANKITTTYTAVNNEDVVNKGSLNTVLGSYLTVINAAATYATIATVNNKADTFYVDVQDGLRVLKTGDTMSGDLTVNGTVLAYTLNSNAWARFEDYREGMSPFNQPSASMGYYFGTHNNNDTTPYSDLLCLNGWFDGSGGNVNLISFNKGGKGIRQFQGTHGSKTNFSTYFDCVMTDENSSNVSMGGALKFPNMGDCRIYNGSADAYNPTSTANNLIIKSWWGIGYESYDGGVRIAMDTRTGSAYFGGNLGVKTTSPEGDLHVQLSGAVTDYWGKLKVKTTSFWGDGCSSRSETAGIQYATMFPMMFLAPHVVSDTDGWCYIRMGRANGVATGRWWEIANRSDGYFQIGVERSNQISIHPNGAVNMPGAGVSSAVPNGYMTGGSLTIGSTDRNYGGGSGWSSNTAGLMMECADNTEIAIHDGGTRVVSFMWYSGGTNTFAIGRDMGWGVTRVLIPGQAVVGGSLLLGANGRGLNGAEEASNTYGNVSTWGDGRNGWRGYGLDSRYCLMKSNTTAEGGIHDNTYSWLLRWEGNDQRLCHLGQALRVGLNWDRMVVWTNGYDQYGGYLYFNAAGNLGVASDERIKEHIEEIHVDKSIIFIQNIKPSSYCLKEKPKQVETSKDPDGNPIHQTCSVCNCKQEGFIAQNILKACELSGCSKSALDNWVDYEAQLGKPEEERTAVLGVSDRPILSHTVNVVKHLLDENETLKEEIKQLKDIIYQHNELLKKISERLK